MDYYASRFSLRVLRGLCGSLILFVSSCPMSVRAAEAPKPEVKFVSDLGVRVGRTTTVTLYGDNLAPKEVQAKPAGVKATLGEVRATGDKEKERGSKAVKVELTVPPNAARETLELTLVGTDGVKATAKVAIVDDVSQEVEVRKPAATFAQAMPITASSAITGTLDGDTADVFRLDAKAGETWNLTLLGSRVGSPLDALLRVRDSRHNTILLDGGDKKRDRHIAFKAPKDGSYYVEITDAESKGGPTYRYRLTVLRKP